MVKRITNRQRLDAVRDQVVCVLAENHMYDPQLFGSSARGEDTDLSDIDLMVSTDQPLGFFGLAVLEQQLSDIVGVPVDVVYRRSLKPAVIASALKEAVSL